MSVLCLNNAVVSIRSEGLVSAIPPSCAKFDERTSLSPLSRFLPPVLLRVLGDAQQNGRLFRFPKLVSIFNHINGDPRCINSPNLSCRFSTGKTLLSPAILCCSAFLQFCISLYGQPWKSSHWTKNRQRRFRPARPTKIPASTKIRYVPFTTNLGVRSTSGWHDRLR